MEWPIYFKNLLTVGDLDSEVAIVTLWTKREQVVKDVDKEKYAVIGQLYSKDEGLNGLIRNCLVNKKIRHLIIVGEDLTDTGEALVRLFEDGVDENKHISGMDYAVVDKEIPKRAIEEFRNNVDIHDYRNLEDFSKLDSIIENFKKRGSYGEPETFPEPDIKMPQVFPNEKVGFVIREDLVGDAWLRVLNLIMRFGKVKKSQYDMKQKELINVTITVDKEDTDEIVWRDFYPFTKEELEKYIPTVTTPKEYTSLEYSYGERLMKFRGIDQIKNIIEELKAHDFTRRAVACTWDVVTDIKSDKAPCLDLVQCLIQDGRLYLTAFFRSNDMFASWPMNIYALRKLQKNIAEDIGVGMGSITTVSCSAHIYKMHWENAKGVIEKNEIKSRELGDPRGNFRIFLEDRKIKVIHMTPEGKRIDAFEGKKAIEIYRKMVKDLRVHDQFHAFDLGAELQKAEIALERGIEYNQDQELNFEKKMDEG